MHELNDVNVYIAFVQEENAPAGAHRPSAKCDFQAQAPVALHLARVEFMGRVRELSKSGFKVCVHFRQFSGPTEVRIEDVVEMSLNSRKWCSLEVLRMGCFHAEAVFANMYHYRLYLYRCHYLFYHPSN